MPLYEFRCPQGHDFEKFYRSMGSAKHEETCPECGAIGARLMSTAGLVFKGSGFYITDYGKDGKKAEREAAKSAATKSEASSAPATEAPSPKTTESAPAAETKAAPDPKPAAAVAKPAPSPKKAE